MGPAQLRAKIIASKRAQDIEQLLNAIGQWIKSHPEKIDRSL